jgi:hypothetical protein
VLQFGFTENDWLCHFFSRYQEDSGLLHNNDTANAGLGLWDVGLSLAGAIGSILLREGFKERVDKA